MKHFELFVKFVRELFKKKEGFIPLHSPVFSGNEKKYLDDCIVSTFVSSVGKYVDEFEQKIGEFTGAGKAIACVNGTSALHMALILAGVKRDTEVITQPLTFIATANSIAYCNAIPVFIDVDFDTMGLSPVSLRKWLEENAEIKKGADSDLSSYNRKTNRKISACVPMHTFGHPSRIDKIVEVCNEYYIPLIEDAAESLGSYYNGQHTGTFGRIGVLSFNGNKILTTGGGGMLLFKDEDLAKHAKHLTTQAKVPHPWEFAHDEVGYNYRMPNINAALGLAQLEQIKGFLSAKRKLAGLYKEFFESIGISFVSEPSGSLSNYWLNCILLKDENERNSFLKYTNGNGIMTRPAWKLMNKAAMYEKCQTDKLENANSIAARLVNIPSSVIL